ncbi:MAG: fasciclin domain-containing protein [Candidatus Paceibacterota bacterium]
MDTNKGVWTGLIVIVVIAALGLWWLSSRQPVDTSTDISTSTATGANGAAGGTGATGAGTGNTTGRPVTNSNSDVASIVAGLSGTSEFSALFKSTGVAATIVPQAGGKYTIFVPTNGAFSQLPAGTISKMTSAEKKRLVQYHVVSGRAIDTNAQVAGQIQALSGDALNFSYGANRIPMVNSSIVIAQYNGSNGTVYLIDNVLLPPAKSTI